MSFDYKKAGVDVEAGDALVDWLQSEDEKSRNNPLKSKLVSGIGGFASLFRADFSHMKKPCLVTCTDGIGTKVKLASQYSRYEEVGQDLVAMCVNDLICTGGDPLLFLDYYASSKLDLVAAKSFLKGVRNACDESLCLLVGGETAEMPGVYQGNDFDAAGFSVGVVDEEKAFGPHRVRSGDCLIGVSSSGFHSNGYSLLRKLFEKDMDQWIDQLIKPTTLYVRLMKDVKAACEVHAAAHMTGGGIENIPRVLPENLKLQFKEWDFPEIVLEAQKRAGLTKEQMLKTFNCGVGFVFIVPESSRAQCEALIKQHGFQSFDLGKMQ